MKTRGVFVFFSGTGDSSGARAQEASRHRAPSFSGQLLARARVEFAVFDGLNANDGGDAEDVMGVGTARHIRRRAVEAEKNLAVRIGAGNVLNQFAGDV